MVNPLNIKLIKATRRSRASCSFGDTHFTPQKEKEPDDQTHSALDLGSWEISKKCSIFHESNEMQEQPLQHAQIEHEMCCSNDEVFPAMKDMFKKLLIFKEANLV